MLLKKFNVILGYISGFMVFLTGCIMLYDVFCRYALGSPSIWALNISQYLILTSAFLGASYCLQSGGHVHVEIVVDRVKPLPRKILLTIGNVFAITFVAALLRASLNYAVMSYQYKWDAQGNIPFPSYILYLIMVFGSLMLIITLLSNVIATWRRKEEKEAEEIRC